MSSEPVAMPAAGARDADALAEAQFRDRMARLGSDPLGRARRRKPGSGRRGSGLDWTAWVLIACTAVSAVVAAAVVWPPVSSCRRTDRTIGFYAGDSVEKCIRRGIVERLDLADQTVKMLVRGSGR